MKQDSPIFSICKTARYPKSHIPVIPKGRLSRILQRKPATVAFLRKIFGIIFSCVTSRKTSLFFIHPLQYRQPHRWTFPDAASAAIYQNKRRLIPICRNLIGCRKFLRRFRKNDKAQAIRILYKKDVTVCPCYGGAMSYEVCTERAPKRSSTWPWDRSLR